MHFSPTCDPSEEFFLLKKKFHLHLVILLCPPLEFWRWLLLHFAPFISRSNPMRIIHRLTKLTSLDHRISLIVIAPKNFFATFYLLISDQRVLQPPVCDPVAKKVVKRHNLSVKAAACSETTRSQHPIFGPILELLFHLLFQFMNLAPFDSPR